MTDDEVEVVAEELARAGGTTWYPGREQGSLMRVVSDRYRDRARVAIAALERFRANQEFTCSQDNNATDVPHVIHAQPRSASGDTPQPGLTVVYRPPGDQRAYTCRVVQVEGGRAYLEPILKACTG